MYFILVVNENFLKETSQLMLDSCSDISNWFYCSTVVTFPPEPILFLYFLVSNIPRYLYFTLNDCVGVILGKLTFAANFKCFQNKLHKVWDVLQPMNNIEMKDWQFSKPKVNLNWFKFCRSFRRVVKESILFVIYFRVYCISCLRCYIRHMQIKTQYEQPPLSQHL